MQISDNRHMTTRWKPSATVAAIIEKDGKFLLVEEHTSEGLRLNNPAGHLDQGESLVEACAREALEETTYLFKPTYLLGVYMSRFQRPAHNGTPRQDITYLRLAFCGELGPAQPERALDTGIVRTLWMTPEEIRGSAERHRSPLIIRCMEDYLAGQRFPLDLIYTDATVTQATSRP
jgi:8-oxo-dGTP pyrophosphatase MutT (NUDIX family)